MRKFLSVLLAVMMVLSTVSFAAPSAFKPIDAVVETPVAVAPAEEAVLAAELPEATSGYGELIFELNFDDATDANISNSQIKFTDAGFINPEAELYASLTENASMKFSAWPTHGIKERAPGDKYLEISGATGGYPVSTLSSEFRFQTQEGIYTLTADVYRPNGAPLTTRFSAGHTEDTPIQDFSELNDTGWGSIILQHDPSCFGNGGHSKVFESIGEVSAVKFHLNRNANGDEVFGFDNIRLYYKPLTVNVTINTDTDTITAPISTNGVTVSDFAEALDLDFYQTASKVVIGGVTYDTDDVIYLAQDCEADVEIELLDEAYYDDEMGIILFDIDFESHDVGTAASSSSQIPLANYLTPIGATYLSHDVSYWNIHWTAAGGAVMVDPANATNKVLGALNQTSTGYPCALINVSGHNTAERFGFVEDPNLIWTVTYDYYDSTNDGIAIRFGGRSSVSENEGLNKWTSVEDVPYEYRYDSAPAVWHRIVGVMAPEKYSRMGGSDEISFIKLHSASPSAADLYYDNIKIYFKPQTTTVTIDKGEYDVILADAILENVETAGLTVSELLEKAGFEYDMFKYSFQGVTVGNSETVYGLSDEINIGGKTTIHLVMEEVDLDSWTDENGIVVMEFDFENIDTVPLDDWSRTLVTELGRANPSFPYYDKWHVNFSNIKNPEIVTDPATGSKVLKVNYTTTGSQAWPQFLYGWDSNGDATMNHIIADNGTFYATADIKVTNTDVLNGASLTTNGFRDGTHQGPAGIMGFGTSLFTNNGTLTANNWYTISGTNTPANAGCDGPTKFTLVFDHNGVPAGEVNTIYFDNIKVCWKPETVKLTVYGGSNPNYETVTVDVPASATIDQIAAALPVSEYGRITGLADLEGKRLDSFESLTSTSVVAIWTPWTILEGGQEFAIDASGRAGGGSGQWTGFFGDSRETGTLGDHTTAIHFMNDFGWKSVGGNLIVTFQGSRYGDADNGLLTSPTPWETPAAHSVEAYGNIREIVNTSLAASNDAEFVLVKYRYDNLPNLAEVYANDPNPEGYKYTLSEDGNSLTYYDREGNVRTFEMAPDYGKMYYIQCNDDSYQYAGGYGLHQNELMVEDEWYYDVVPFNSVLNEKGVKSVVIQTYNRYDEQVTEYDYVRFLKTGDKEDAIVLPELGGSVKIKAPTTVDTAEARISDDQYGNGIRFKASVLQKTAEVTEDLGWIVTTQAYCYNNIGTEEDLTLAAETDVNDPKVKVAYQIKDGEAQANFYGGTDEEPVFSAVLYGIPLEHMYDLIVVRPFAKAGTSEKYGDPVVTSLFDTAIAPYIVLSEDYDYVRDLAMINESLEEAFDYGDIEYADAYNDLSEEHKAYVDEMLAADFELGLEM